MEVSELALPEQVKKLWKFDELRPAQEKAIKAAKQLIETFPDSYYGKRVAKELEEPDE